ERQSRQADECNGHALLIVDWRRTRAERRRACSTPARRARRTGARRRRSFYCRRQAGPAHRTDPTVCAETRLIVAVETKRKSLKFQRENTDRIGRHNWISVHP